VVWNDVGVGVLELERDERSESWAPSYCVVGRGDGGLLEADVRTLGGALVSEPSSALDSSTGTGVLLSGVGPFEVPNCTAY
jgi:hypothetical protein